MKKKKIFHTAIVCKATTCCTLNKSWTHQWRPTRWFVVILKMDEFALAIELKSGSKILFSALKSFPVTSTLSDVCNSFNQSANLAILKVEVSEQQTGPWRQTEDTCKVSMLVPFNARHVVFWMGRPEEDVEEIEDITPADNAFTVLMVFVYLTLL